MPIRSLVLLVVIAAIAAGGGAFAAAQNSRTVSVEVTVWRSVADPSLLYVSARPEGGRWRTRETPLDMSALSASGRFHQSDAVTVTVALPEPEPEPPACDTSRAPWSSIRQSAREEALDRARRPDGSFLGRYTGVVRSQDGVQVDHIVPRNYACENGGLDWDDEKARAFVNDPENLAVVASSENARKGDKGPADYLPAINQCWYAARWERLAARYELDLPAPDRERLAALLAEPRCRSWSEDPTPTPTPSPTPSATPSPTPSVTYASCEEAEAAGVERVEGGVGDGSGFPAALVPDARDGDGDGVVCER